MLPIIKKFKDVLFKYKLVRNINVKYDKENHQLFVSFPDKLKIKILNNIDIETSSELNVETNSEINVLSHDNINIDSLDSKIFLNSFQCKQIRNISKYAVKRENQINNNELDKLDENIPNQQEDNLKILAKKLFQLENRLRSLEHNVFKKGQY